MRRNVRGLAINHDGRRRPTPRGKVEDATLKMLKARPIQGEDEGAAREKEAEMQATATARSEDDLEKSLEITRRRTTLRYGTVRFWGCRYLFRLRKTTEALDSLEAAYDRRETGNDGTRSRSLLSMGFGAAIGASKFSESLAPRIEIRLDLGHFVSLLAKVRCQKVESVA